MHVYRGMLRNLSTLAAFVLEVIRLRLFLHIVFDAFDVAATKAFDFATEFEIPPDLGVIENAETVDNGSRVAEHTDHGLRGEV